MVFQRKKLSPPQVAKMLGCSTAKVVGFIKSGELTAMNLAGRECTRPRYMIDVSALEAFEISRQVVPSPATTTLRLRRRASPGVKEFV